MNISQYITLNTGPELICLIIALICLRADKNIVWRSMLLFQLVICFMEIFAIYIKWPNGIHNGHAHPNSWLYNILLVFQIGFISLMFNLFLGNYLNRKLIIISGLALFSVLYFYELFDHGFFYYNNLTNIVSSIVFVLYSLYYYYLLINSDHYEKLIYAPQFWWVAGTLFFYFGKTACNIFYGKLSAIMITPQQNITHYIIYPVLNVILYGLWSYSFICRKWLTPILKN